MQFFGVYLTFLKTIIYYLFGISSTSRFHFISKNIFSTSFRIPQADRSRFFLALIFPIARILRAKIAKTVTFSSASEKCVYDSNRIHLPGRLKFLNYFTKENFEKYVFKQELFYFANVFTKKCYFLFALPIIFLLFLISIFKKDKAPYALLPMELIENYNLIKFCLANKIKEVFFFSIFEKDSNMTAYLLMNRNIKVNKIPSEVPLTVWNNIIVADKLCMCNGYQLEEVKHFSSSMFIGETEMWGPEQMMEVYDLYKGKFQNAPHNTLAFYSTASWVRKLEGQIDQGYNMEEEENKLKAMLSEYLQVRSDIKLTIYLHPKERSEKYLEKALLHYGSNFKKGTYAFASVEKRSSASFADEDVALAFVTTLMYERIYFGFKSLFMPIAIKNFPLKGSGLENICIHDKKELFDKLDEVFKLSNEEFFTKNKLQEYKMKIA